MSDIAPSRPTMQVEETKFEAAVSESVVQRLAAGVNMANLNYYSIQWFFQGNLGWTVLGGAGYTDGIRAVLKKSQIIGYMYQAAFSLTGDYSIQLTRFTSNGALSGDNVFSTNPLIAIPPVIGGVPGPTQVMDFSTNTVLQSPGGDTMGVLGLTTLDAGDLLGLTIGSIPATTPPTTFGIMSFQLFLRPSA